MKQLNLFTTALLTFSSVTWGQVNQQPYLEEGTWQNEQYLQYGLPSFHLTDLSFSLNGDTYNPSGTKYWYHEDSYGWDNGYPENPGYFGIKAVNEDGSTDEIYLDPSSGSLRYLGTTAEGKVLEVTYTSAQTSTNNVGFLDDLVFESASTWNEVNGYQSLASKPENFPESFNLGDKLTSQSSVDWINNFVGFSMFNNPPNFESASAGVIKQAQELNIGLEFRDGQWVPAQ